MSLSHKMFTLNQSAVIVTVPDSQEQQYSKELSISIQNLDSEGFVFIGDSSVTPISYGFRIDPGQSFISSLAPKDEIYAVCDSGSFKVAVIWVQH